jgi:hypothetical protein
MCCHKERIPLVHIVGEGRDLKMLLFALLSMTVNLPKEGYRKLDGNIYCSAYGFERKNGDFNP